MISTLVVTCPHCQAQGTMLLPPEPLVIGPCPECHEPILVIGHILPLCRDLLNQSSPGEKADHICGIVLAFLKEQLQTLYETADDSQPAGISDEEAEELIRQIRQLGP